MQRFTPLFAFSLISLLSYSIVSAAEFTVEKDAEGVTVKVDGKFFTKYLIKSGIKPILWPIVGPTGKEMTRAYPMRPDAEGEKKDHPHQRSFWFTHGNVNGIDFWSEVKNEKNNPGHEVHREFVKVEGGKQAVIVTRNDWIGPGADGKKVCEDERTLTFGADKDARWIDCDVVVTASAGEVKFGDTKEGSFGVRVPTTMDVDSKKGGEIVSSEGLKDKEAWGKPAPWVDYHGPVGDETLGIAILNHPSSFRHPTTWHVRTYGLFAANPFGLKDFTGDKTKTGEYVLESGKTMNMRHRVIFHSGDEKAGKIAERYAEYSKVLK